MRALDHLIDVIGPDGVASGLGFRAVGGVVPFLSFGSSRSPIMKQFCRDVIGIGWLYSRTLLG
ncbi:MAG: hypothetical protein A4S16_09025 [Proteobacteria bacterium SG_bin6]|nr:MAG: hypothetical protein A4S16_09025 [Proteobacteria bacterium SG_bin6]